MATKKREVSKHSNLEIPLFEMQRSLQNTLDGIDLMKGTIRTVFGSASLIVSLIGALQLFSTTVATAWMPVYQGMLIAVAALYLTLIVVCVLGMLPIRTSPVLPYDWDTLSVTFQNMTDHEMTAMHLSAVLQSLEKNTPLVNRIYRLQVAALAILPILVLLILGMAWLPRG
jgi:hypothetical protein